MGLMYSVDVYVNSDRKGTKFATAPSLGESKELAFDVFVDDDPEYVCCRYEIEVVMNASDGRASNNSDTRLVTVEAGNCQGQPNQGDLEWISQHGDLDHLIEHKFEGLVMEQWDTDAHGAYSDIGSNAPIFDPIPPPACSLWARRVPMASSEHLLAT